MHGRTKARTWLLTTVLTLMSAEYDSTELSIEADRRIQSFQRDGSRDAGIFHHLITLPTYRDCTVCGQPGEEYFGEQGMLLATWVAFSVRKSVRVSLALSTRTWPVPISVMTTKSTSLVRTL